VKRRKHRVLHIVTRLELGGAQQNTLFCMVHHDRTRFDVGLIAGRGGILDAEALEIDDADVRLLPTLRHAIAPFWDLLTILKLRSYIRAQRIDLVHTHSSKAGILGRAAAVLAGVPVILHTVHGWSFNDTQPAWLRGVYVTLERVAARFTHRLIVVSSRNRDCGLIHGIGREDQYDVIHSGIDIESFRRPPRNRESVRRELGIEPGQILVGTVACLKPQKAPLDFVRAAAEAHARDDRLRFILVGDGELAPQTHALVRELGLTGIVQLLGWRRDVVELLHAMDVFLLTSLFEGLPRAVLQAMAAGVPVIATAVDGTPEVVRDRETGLLVPPARPDEAARGVLEIVQDAELRSRCVRQAQRALDNGFDVNRMVVDLDRLYLQLLEGV
jgi:glycosyltransferase involved in cell wall biosynthesis